MAMLHLYYNNFSWPKHCKELLGEEEQQEGEELEVQQREEEGLEEHLSRVGSEVGAVDHTKIIFKQTQIKM